MKEKKSVLFISCDEAKRICDKAQYSEATSWEKFKLKLRYAWCQATKAYVGNNTKLTIVITESKIKCLNASEKAHLQHNFKQEQKKN